jgi:hypothetical protein
VVQGQGRILTPAPTHQGIGSHGAFLYKKSVMHCMTLFLVLSLAKLLPPTSG